MDFFVTNKIICKNFVITKYCFWFKKKEEKFVKTLESADVMFSGLAPEGRENL